MLVSVQGHAGGGVMGVRVGPVRGGPESWSGARERRGVAPLRRWQGEGQPVGMFPATLMNRQSPRIGDHLTHVHMQRTGNKRLDAGLMFAVLMEGSGFLESFKWRGHLGKRWGTKQSLNGPQSSPGICKTSAN